MAFAAVDGDVVLALDAVAGDVVVADFGDHLDRAGSVGTETDGSDRVPAEPADDGRNEHRG